MDKRFDGRAGADQRIRARVPQATSPVKEARVPRSRYALARLGQGFTAGLAVGIFWSLWVIRHRRPAGPDGADHPVALPGWTAGRERPRAEPSAG